MSRHQTTGDVVGIVVVGAGMVAPLLWALWDTWRTPPIGAPDTSSDPLPHAADRSHAGNGADAAADGGPLKTTTTPESSLHV